MRSWPMLIGLLVALAACSPATASVATTPSAATAGSSTPVSASLTPISLPMGYIADIQFAPFYVAAAKGYYQAEGLDVTFNYIYEDEGVKLVAAGKVPFAIVSGEQVPLARANGLPITYVMDWFQKFPVAVVSKASTGIKTPADLAGKTIGIPGHYGASYIGFRGLLSKAGLKEDQMTLQDIGFTQVAALTGDKVQAVVGYTNNEPIQLKASGMDVSVLPVADYVDLVANGLVTNDQTIAEQPDLIRKMVRATLRGIVDTIANPDEAFTLSKNYVKDLGGSKEAIQKQILLTSIDLWKSPKPGAVDPGAWDTTQEVLVSMGLLQKTIDVKQLYNDQFLSP